LLRAGRGIISLPAAAALCRPIVVIIISTCAYAIKTPYALHDKRVSRIIVCAAATAPGGVPHRTGV
jgi:hypothetical protein